MSRPSIFSKEYERNMKKRKRRIIFIVIFLGIVSGTFFVSGNLKTMFKDKLSKLNISKSIFTKQKDKKETEVNKNITDKPADNTQNSTQNNTPVSQDNDTQENTGYEMTLSDQTKISAVYENKDGAKRFKYIMPLDAPVSFSVNPSGNAMVILDNKSQNMLLVDISGNVQDITNKQYVSKSTVYKKDNILEKYQKYNYVWCTSPKFVDDENIAYLSQLPHISSKITKKFLWTVNIKDINKHVNKYNVSGENIKLGNLKDNGLEVTFDDGTTKYIKIDNGDVKITDQ